MASTNFNISFVESSDCCIISFVDLTAYNEDIPIDTPILKILYPDHSAWVSMSYTPMSINNVGVPLLDGLYTLELSVCPNDKAKKIFYYFKVCGFLNNLKTQLCKYSGNKEKVLELMELYKYALALQMIAQTEPEKAKIMFNYLKIQIC
jgi:hypothetical protein